MGTSCFYKQKVTLFASAKGDLVLVTPFEWWRPCKHWLQTWVLRWALLRCTHRVSIAPICLHSFHLWTDFVFLRSGIPLERVSKHIVVSADASNTGWGAIYNEHMESRSWTGPQLRWNINYLKFLAYFAEDSAIDPGVRCVSPDGQHSNDGISFTKVVCAHIECHNIISSLE